MLYVADRAQSVLTVLSHYYTDTQHLELTAGASTYTFTISKTEDGTEYLTTGNRLLFVDDKGKPWAFTILTAKATHNSIVVTAEDVGIEFINKMMPAWPSDGQHSFEYYFNKIRADTDWELGINEIADLSRTLTYTGRDTGLGRLLSVLNGFDDAEVQFEIKTSQLKVTNWVVNVYKKIGADKTNQVQMVYSNEINDITREESRTAFVTKLSGVGSVIEGTDPTAVQENVSFADIEYDDGDFYSPKGDEFIYARTANQVFNPDGHYVEDYYDYDTDNKQELFNRTLSQLKTRSEPAVNYSVDVVKLDSSLEIGDYVAMIDHKFKPAQYLQARILSLDKSYREKTQNKATFGNYKIIKSNLLDQLTQLRGIINQMPNGSTINIINNVLNNLEGITSNLQSQIITAVTSADGKNTNYLNGRPSNAKNGDLAFMLDGDHKEIWQFVDGSWIKIISDADSDDIKKQIEQQQTDIQVAKDDAKNAVDTATAAITEAQSTAAKLGTVADLTSQATNLATTAIGQAGDAAASAASAMISAQNALDQYANMQIGGRNYLLNTGTTFTYAGSPSNQIIGHMDVEQLNLLRGKDVVFSFYANAINAKGATGQSHRIVVEGKIYFTDGTTRYMTITKSIAVGESFTGRIIQPMTMTDKVASAGVDFRGYFQDNYDSAYMDQWQLELGNVATDYSQAPEDVQVQITNLNGELSQKVSQSTYDTLAGRVTTNETLATQNKNAITLKADKTDVDTINKTVSQQSASLTTIAGQISGLTTNTTTIDGKLTTLQGQFDLTSKQLTTTMSDVKDNKATLTTATQTANAAQLLATNNKGDIASLNVTAKDMQTTLANAATQNQLTATASQLTSQISGLTSDTNSSITQLQDQINLRVDSDTFNLALGFMQESIDISVKQGELLSEINTQADRILISSNKLYLDADTVAFSGKAFIPSAAITDLTADKIKTGTLDASLVDVININAANINAGSLSALTSSTGDLQLTGKLTAGPYYTTNSNLVSYAEAMASTSYINSNWNWSNGAWNMDAKWMSKATGSWQVFQGSTIKIDPVFGIKYAATGTNNAVASSFEVEGVVDAAVNIKHMAMNLTNSSMINIDSTSSIVFGGTNGLSGVKFNQYGNIIGMPQSGNWNISNKNSVQVLAVTTDATNLNVTAKAFVNTSKLSTKMDIKPLKPDEAIDKLLSTDIYSYRYIDSGSQGQIYYSPVIDDQHQVPEYRVDGGFVTDDHESRIDGNMVGALVEAVKYFKAKVDNQEGLITNLQQQINEMKLA